MPDFTIKTYTKLLEALARLDHEIAQYMDQLIQETRDSGGRQNSGGRQKNDVIAFNKVLIPIMTVAALIGFIFIIRGIIAEPEIRLYNNEAPSTKPTKK